MSNKHSLFDSDVSEDEAEHIDINFGNKYAKQYNDWRRKEEMQRLKDKYGDNLDIMSEIEDDSDKDDDREDDSDSESSNVQSEDEEFDEQFVTVLSALKNKDPKIYDKNFRIQSKEEESEKEEEEEDEELEENTKGKSKKKKESEKKMTLPEYHKKLLKEKKGITEEDEGLMNPDYDEDDKPAGYYQELQKIRQEIKDIAKDCSDEEDDNMFSVKGQILPSNSEDSQAKHEIDLLKIWDGKKNLDKNDAFLRDYIVNKRYTESADDISKVKKFQEPSTHFGGFENYDENQMGNENDEEEENGSDDGEEKTLSKKATEGVLVKKYHFEEPDANVIKRFPRNVQSVRDTISKDTKTKRAEVREKKKLEKQSELKKMRRLKREELESRITKLKEVSGNKKLDIKDLDLNVIIDDENDFDLEKYDEKMNALFGNDYYNIDEDTEKPEFDYCEGIDDGLYPDEEQIPKCIERNKKWSKKKANKKLDIMKDDDIGIYEDLIAGEIATRFRYRMVENNDFGLTDEEILFADEKELNRWCSLKKMSQYRSKGEEDNDKKNFDLKKDNMELKRRILKSLYGEESKENPIIKAFSKRNGGENALLNNQDDHKDDDRDEDVNGESLDVTSTEVDKKKKNKKRGKKKKNPQQNNEIVEKEETVENAVEEDTEQKEEKEDISNNKNNEKNEIKNQKSDVLPTQNISKSNRKRKRPQNNKNSNNKNNFNNKNNIGNSGLSEARLKAYGMSNREIKRVKL